MQARLKIKPEHRGTRKLPELYASRLICVRRRCDEQRQKRFKTVEIVVEEIPRTPKPKPIEKRAVAGLRIELEETDLRRRVKAAGGEWNPARCLWKIRYDQAVVLGLQSGVEPSMLPNSGKDVLPNSRQGGLPTIRREVTSPHAAPH